jgi:hypothetical protein
MHEHDMTIRCFLQPRQDQLSHQASVNGDHASELGHNVLILAGRAWTLASMAHPD